MRRSTRFAPAAVLVAGTLLLVGCGSSGDSATGTSTTSVAVTETTAVETTTDTAIGATTVPVAEQPDAVWPFVDSAVRYSDPVAAAEGFATTYLGFVDPVIGEFQQGDSNSGEVAVQAKDSGPVTRVMVRTMGDDDSWWVLGAATANIEIGAPDALATVTSPVTISGQSTAFEGTINLEVRADQQTEPLVEGFTMGGSMGELAPFSTELTFDAPAVAGGAIVVKTMSAEDGNISEASVVRVHF